MRRKARIGAITAFALACCLGLSLWLAVRQPAAPARTAASVLPQRQPWGPAEGDRAGVLAAAAPLAPCEARIEREPRRLPTIAIVGASVTAGTGPGNPLLSWAVVLAGLLHWNAVIDGVPGAGFVRAGNGGHGPMTRMLSAEGLSALAPSVVIMQAGHDDLGVPPAAERAGVSAALGLVHLAAPRARVALLTVFARTLDGTPGLWRTDNAIVTSGRAASTQVIVMDPLAGQWKFDRASDGLHPTAAGDAWIAGKVLAILSAHGVSAAPATSGIQPVICDASVGVQHATSASA